LVNTTSLGRKMAHAPGLKPRKRVKSSRRAAQSSSLVARLRQQLGEARRTIAELKLRADTDSLLDILNRRGFERELRRSIAYVKRYHTTAALLYLDVDRLKPINDRLGHAAGDTVLKAIAQELVDHVRMSDVAARLGGDEFGLLLWNLSAEDAAKKARALEAAIDRLPIMFRGRALRIGVSAGVTMLRPTDETADVLARADQAMYLRKQARRTSRHRRSRPRRLKR
jgi:diguanylate cyclase (GGDEF)-like protein